MAKYSSLPHWQNQSLAVEALEQWEHDHPGDCKRERDEGQFFGFKEVAHGYLGRYTRLVFIPAVQDASEAAQEGRDSLISLLLDLLVRRALQGRPDFLALKSEIEQKYQAMMGPTAPLDDVQLQLSSAFQLFVPGAEVEVDWLPLTSINIPLPRASVRLVEDGYSSTVGLTGHGSQRAFILALLQCLTRAEASSSETTAAHGDESLPPGPLAHLLFAIEEPELYQHPNRQRYIAEMLQTLVSGKVEGTAECNQVIYATHSPLFVGIDRFENIRTVRKMVYKPGWPMVSHLKSAKLTSVATALWRANGSKGAPYTAETLRPRLISIMTPWMNEGFFADLVVLVEGEDDRAVILGAARAEGLNLESRGVSVIPCNGKTNIDRPLVIFRDLDIRVYPVWDSDRGGNDPKVATNRRLLSLLGAEVVDYPGGVTEQYACFESDLNETLVSEMGAGVFKEALSKAQAVYDISEQDQAIKNPGVLELVMTIARDMGRKCESVNAIVSRITAR